jgi:hypothetical protein
MLLFGLVTRSASVLEISTMLNLSNLKDFRKHSYLLTDAPEIGIRELMLFNRATPKELAINGQEMFEGAEGSLL